MIRWFFIAAESITYRDTHVTAADTRLAAPMISD